MSRSMCVGSTLLLIATSAAAAGSTLGEIRCKQTTHKIERAEISIEEDGSRQVRVQLFKPGESSYFAELNVTVRKSIPAFYHLYALCPEMQYNVNRFVGTGPGDSDDFREFAADLRRGGKVDLKVSGIEEMFDGLTWNLEVSGRIDPPTPLSAEPGSAPTAASSGRSGW